MKPVISILFLLFVNVFTAQAQKIINDPNAEVRKVSSFRAVHISNSFEVVLTQSAQEALAVSANDPKYLPDIKTSVENGILRIRADEDKKFRLPVNRKLKAYISVKNLDELRVTGASEVKIEGSLKANTLKLNVVGASKLNGDLQVDRTLEVELSGASDLNITGSADEVQIDASGASDVKAFDFRTSVANIAASGACNIRITIDKELSANLSGASNVAYKGSAVVRNIKTSGASSVNRKS